MGKLAERYMDCARSGLYGVSDENVPRAAAREAGARLHEVDATRLPSAWPSLERELGAEPARPCVLLVAEAGSLASVHGQAVLEALAAATREARERGYPFFAVMVDPEARLGLPPLYREKPTR